MSNQPVEANVVLTSDNSQYDQAMNQSSTVTQNLGQNVDSLGSKISKLTKTAGKSLIGISAADIGLITASTAAWSSYEKQMTRLQAQSAVLTRTTTEQSKLMKDYTGAVKGLRTEYGMTTTAAASLVQTLSKVTNNKNTRDLKDLSKVFADMSNATGESADGLGSSLVQLQKLMGAPVNTKTTRMYADQFTYLAAQTNTSAQGLVDFASQLAPVGKQIGMTNNQIAGFATAITRTGADAGPAAQVFTKITTDIAHSMQTGSPEIAHYANLLGVTQKAFKQMGGGEQVIEIMEKLHSEGRGAATELARLGLDGPRSMRAIQSIIQQGGFREAMGLAQTGEGSASQGAAKRGSNAAMDTLSAQMGKLKEQTQELGETFGEEFAPAIEAFVKGMTKAMQVVNAIASGPIGQLIGWVMKIVAPFAAGAGAILLFAGALVKLAGVFALFRSSAPMGLLEGARGKAAISGDLTDENQYLGRGPREMGRFGQKLAGVTSDRPGTWLQRGGYNVGNYLGRGAAAIPSGIRDASYWVKEQFDPNYQRPTGAATRKPMSYVAGGLGRAIDWTVGPTFEQMRYPDDPTKRTAGMMMGQVAPWAKLSTRMEHAGNIANETLAGKQLGAISEERARVQAEPLLTDAERNAKLASLDTMKEEATARKTSAQEAKAATLAQIESQKSLTRENGNTAVGARNLREALMGSGPVGGGMSPGGSRGGAIGAIGGGMWGGAKFAGRQFMASGMAYPAMGMAAMAGVSALPGDAGSSKMLQLGAAGMMMGPEVAAIGAVTGAIIDMAQSNKALQATLESLKATTDSLTKSGVGVVDWFQGIKDAQKQLNDTSKSRGASTGSFWFGSPTHALGAMGNAVTDIFGKSSQQKDQEEIDRQKKRGETAEQVARDLAAKTGTKISGTAATQRQELDEFMQGTGSQRMRDAGLDAATVIAAKTKAENKLTPADVKPIYDMNHNLIDTAGQMNKANQKAYQDMLDKIQAPDMAAGQRAAESGTAGAALLQSKAAQESIRHQENTGAFYQGTSDVFEAMKKQGLSNSEMMHSVAQAQHSIADDNDRQSEILTAVSAKIAQATQFQAPFQGRVANFQQSISQLGALEGITPATPGAQAQLEQQKTTSAQGVAGQVQYVQQMLLMQDQYEISKKRAEVDYHEQQTYQLHDYNLQRTRAEYQFNLQRGRETADYYRNLKRSNLEWTIQRNRQEQEFNHQTELQAKQMADSVYSVYQRVQVERTSSAEWLIANAHDQMVKMQEQEANIRKLRKEGLSDSAMQTLQLTDPAHAQEAARLAASATRTQIRQMNQEMGQARTDAAKPLVTDPGGADAQERMYQYKKQRRQALEDHNRSMTWSREDFMRQLRQQKQDFNTLMENQSIDFQTSTDRQEKAYRKSMNRSAEDLANAGKEINGSVEQILKQGTTHLSGYALAAAQAALKTFEGLKHSTRPVAIAIMTDLADIFGFEYQAPKGSANWKQSSAAPNTPMGGGTRSTGGRTLSDSPGTGGFHKGGVVPGWSPGTDDTMVPLSGGEAIMRPEWARRVGEKNIDAMNHAAKHGGFAAGGIFRPINKPVTNGLHDQYTGYTAIDFATPVGTPVYAVESGKITKSYDITGIEARRALYGKSQDGYRSYGRVMYLQTSAGPEVLYAHLSKRGFGAGARVQGGQAIGLSGDTGNSTGPHLHFGDNDGDPYEFAGGNKGAGTIAGFVAGVSAAVAKKQFKHEIHDVFKKRYAEAEKASKAMQGVHPLFPGDISTVINRFGHKAVQRLMKKYGMPAAAGDTSGIGSAPSGHLGNEKLVHTAANRMGWGNQWDDLRQIVMHESGFNNTAQNPTSTAYGMFQFLDSTWANYGGHKTSNPWQQAQYGMNYIKSRYKDPHGAWDFWQAHNWYGDGAVFNGRQTIGVGERGPEAVIPLNDRGGEFLTKAMMGVDARRIGLGSSAAGRGISVFNTRIDRSTNFTGPITVQAQDPGELLAKLQARKRVMALSRPALTGSAA